MVDTEFAVEPMLAWDRLLVPIPGPCPSGVSLRNTEEYDKLPKSLRPQDTGPDGVWQRDHKKTDYRTTIRDASDLLATKSKDLDIAVWLTEALVREHGLPGLAEGLLLIQRLVGTFWDSIYPQLDGKDEGFRAKPIRRLNGVIRVVLPHLPVTFDGRTVHQYNASIVLPLKKDAEKAKNSSELLKKYNQAVDDGVIPPEDMLRSIVDDTKWPFYQEMADDIRQASDAAVSLQKTCNERFVTGDCPSLGDLMEELERVRLTIEDVQRQKMKYGAAEKPVEQPPAPVPTLAPVAEVKHLPAIDPPQNVPEPTPVPTSSVPISPGPQSVFVLAADLRRQDASSPVAYMLVRSWQFGPILAKGSVDEETLEPPGTELKTALRRALLKSDWHEVLCQTEQAMEASCGAWWLDIQRYSTQACKELGYEGAANGIRGMTATYVRSLPNLMYAVMLDGSPTATADTLAWIRTEVLLDPEKDRTESLDDVRPIQFDASTEDEEPDAFEVAENELSAGRFGEAFRVLAEAAEREHAGRSRIQRKIQLAKICMEGGQSRIALALLQEIWAVIEDRRLESWEAPDFVGPPMAMLYKCFGQVGNSEEQRRIYDRLCAVDPAKALALADQS
jgi:type VI secretion system protein ImpA